MSHRIRLAGKWNCKYSDNLISLERRFHAPTGIDASSNVRLAWKLPTNIELERAILNGEDVHPLLADSTHLLEIATILKSFNVLELQIPRMQADLEVVSHFSPRADSPYLLEAWIDIEES